ncbi:hypothetical protein F3B35_16560 [Bacteroides intestinalis]|nr:hypothetical protein F3B35_16560 [Bacteroides intestinalis]
MPKDTKTLGNSKARACESLGFVHKKRLCQSFDTTSLSRPINKAFICFTSGIISLILRNNQLSTLVDSQ